MGVSGKDLDQIMKLRCDSVPFAENPKGNEDAKRVLPELICTVEYMSRTENGRYRQPVFKGIERLAHKDRSVPVLMFLYYGLID